MLCSLKPHLATCICCALQRKTIQVVRNKCGKRMYSEGCWRQASKIKQVLACQVHGHMQISQQVMYPGTGRQYYPVSQYLPTRTEVNAQGLLLLTRDETRHATVLVNLSAKFEY